MIELSLDGSPPEVIHLVVCLVAQARLAPHGTDGDDEGNQYAIDAVGFDVAKVCITEGGATRTLVAIEASRLLRLMALERQSLDAQGEAHLAAAVQADIDRLELEAFGL